ncbi:MAG: DNA (cytosine-5-)-methyltransferase [Bacilli bacterium]|nr:DNA (cytosine-5-)-methyltransferase [Bacilli bacterium]
MHKKIRLATVFSGIGAIEQALLRMNENYEVVFACDNGEIDVSIDSENELKKVKKMRTIQEKKEYANSFYKKTRRTNYVEQTYLNNYGDNLKNNNFFYDIKLLDGTDFCNQVDLFVGGSPCQSFSIAGARGGFEDTRGTLFYDYVRTIKEIEPKVFIYENVYGVLTHDKGKTWEIMKNVFSELGYYFKWQILNPVNYGIPQSRRRLFVIGFKDKNEYEKFSFPEPIELKFTMQDFLLDNCKEGNFVTDEKGNIELIPGGEKVERFLSEKLVNYVMSPGTKNFMHPNDTKINLPIARAILKTQGNTHRASVNNYVTTNGKIRALEPRESLRLMGFPDSFKITVSRAQSYKQSGNSIVVDVLMRITENIIKATGGFDDGKN